MPEKNAQSARYVVLHVSNPEASIRFYKEKLKLQVESYPAASALHRDGKALQVQGTTIILLPTTSTEPAETCRLSFEVDNLRAFHDRMTEIGIEQHQAGPPPIYRDPDGTQVTITERKPASGFVLSGGGAYGAFELGVLRQIGGDPSHPPPKVLTGTSVGAFNAAALACGIAARGNLRTAVDDLIKIWRERVAGGLHDNGVFRIRGDVRRLTHPRTMTRGLKEVLLECLSDAGSLSREFLERLAYIAGPSKASAARRLLETIDISALVSTAPLESLVEDNVSYDLLEKSPCILTVATTDWETGKLRMFTHRPHGQPRKRGKRRPDDEEEMTGANFRESVVASTAIPGIFPPKNVLCGMDSRGNTTRPLVDGGLVMNSPLSPALDGGVTEIHLVCLNPNVNPPRVGVPNNILDVFTRGLLSAIASHIRGDMDRAKLINTKLAGVTFADDEPYRQVTVHKYFPRSEDLAGLTGMLDFSRTHVDELIEDGMKTAQEHKCDLAGCLLAGTGTGTETDIAIAAARAYAVSA